MRYERKLTSGIVSLILFVVLIIMLKKYDVAPVGDAPEIGFSHLNAAIHDFFGVSMLWYEITEILGYVAIAVALLFAAAGFLQLIKRKSLAKVDREIYALAGLYVAMAAVYVLFEKLIINYRPVILADESGYEASFPSSHTMLSCVIFGSVMIMSDIYMEKDIKSLMIRVILSIFIFLTVFGRLLSGVHWFTDIVGGVLISISLVSFFDAVTCLLPEE